MGLKETIKGALQRLNRAYHHDSGNYDLPPIRAHDAPTKWKRPNGDGFVDLGHEQVAYMQDTGQCCYCRSPLYEGPEGGASQNLLCGNRLCDSRFNVGFPPLPWGQFTGRCPKSFFEALEERR